jgi:GDP-4-dehydro-6-deoxy-D-mannose reductase
VPENLVSTSGDRYTYIPCDLSSPDLVATIRDFHPETVVHLAGSLRGISDDVIVQNNLHSTQGLLDTIRKSHADIRMFLFASSGGVYGRQEIMPIA